MKAFVIRKTNFNSIKYAPSRFLFCIHVLFRKCIYIECSWFVDVLLYIYWM